jgi:hypothetical protein
MRLLPWLVYGVTSTVTCWHPPPAPGPPQSTLKVVVVVTTTLLLPLEGSEPDQPLFPGLLEAVHPPPGTPFHERLTDMPECTDEGFALSDGGLMPPGQEVGGGHGQS